MKHRDRVNPQDLRREMLTEISAGASKAERRDRDRAAHMLLFLDQPETVLDLGLEYLVQETATARGDAGLTERTLSEYRPVVVHADPETAQQIAAVPLPNQHPVLQAVWASPTPLTFERVAGNKSLGPLQDTFLDLGMSAMMATALRADGVDMGLLCLDEVQGDRRWRHATIERVQRFVDDWFSPILLASLSNLKAATSQLSASELEAVELLATGLSYRQIARRLKKSPHTIDNQLRSARQKTGSRNAVELIQHLGDPSRRPGAS